MSEWLAVEAIVRQKDKEMMAANLAKLSSESTSGDVPPQTPTAGLGDLSNNVSFNRHISFRRPLLISFIGDKSSSALKTSINS